MGTQIVQMKGVLSWLGRWACRAGTRDFCSALAALVWAQYKIFFFLTVHCSISIYVSPSPSNLGRQSCRAAYYGMCVSVPDLMLRGPIGPPYPCLIVSYTLSHCRNRQQNRTTANNYGTLAYTSSMGIPRVLSLWICTQYNPQGRYVLTVRVVLTHWCRNVYPWKSWKIYRQFVLNV